MIEPNDIHKPLIYLACPYSSDDPDTMVKRFRMVSKVAGQFIRTGNLIYSPISHSHPMAIETHMPTGYDTWRALDEFYLLRSDIFMILTVPGWRESKGMVQEIDFATDNNKPIVLLPIFINVDINRSTDNVPSSSD